MVLPADSSGELGSRDPAYHVVMVLPAARMESVPLTPGAIVPRPLAPREPPRGRMLPGRQTQHRDA